MYFILQTDQTVERIPQIVDHFDETPASAIERLETITRRYVQTEYGAKATKTCRVVDVDSHAEIVQPTAFGAYLYKLTTDPHRIYLFTLEMHTIHSEGYLYNSVSQSPLWKCVSVFDLVSYTMGDQTEETVSRVEMVPTGRHGVRVPKPMTVAPCDDLFRELRNDRRFLRTRHDNEGETRNSLQFFQTRDILIEGLRNSNLFHRMRHEADLEY